MDEAELTAVPKLLDRAQGGMQTEEAIKIEC